ncbi:MAG TPA: sigma-70 family RNA polymerase sigma factor [Eubacteriales bacterium]|nr:sigma-70 family RNA polymerase sigma factor [Clostridia bacterium]HRR89245.1 sigma-70 family RNA polymerase sigma factor [Eubacteriales bacterium]HRU84681.1 sigma-70 family RNA polymerase sigma factor [Eubacteriales bacterium]
MTESVQDKKATDEELLIRAKAGDKAAESELLNRYKPLTARLARRYFIAGGGPEDLAQEGMIALAKAVREYCPEKNASFATYAAVLIKRGIFDAVRAANRKKHRPLNDSVALTETVCDLTFAEPVELMIAEEDSLESSQKINLALGEEEIRALSLYLEGKSYAEIAGALKLTVKGVDNKLQSIRRKLHKILKS